MNLKPLFARVLVERERSDKIGNIIIPDLAQRRHASLKCKVIAKGPNADEHIKEGSWVLIGQHAGTWLDPEGRPTVKEDDAKFYVVQDEDIIAEVKDV